MAEITNAASPTAPASPLPSEHKGILDTFFHRDQPKQEGQALTVSSESIFAAKQSASSAPAITNSATHTIIASSAYTIAVPKEGFWAKIEHAFETLFGRTAPWLSIASNILPLVAPLLVTLLDLTGGPAATAGVQLVINKIEGDMALAHALILQGQATPTLTGALNTIQSNLASILELSQVKDPKVADNITSVVTLITGEIEALIKALPTSANLVLPAPAA
jgi:hypothetical protein